MDLGALINETILFKYPIVCFLYKKYNGLLYNDLASCHTAKLTY